MRLALLIFGAVITWALGQAINGRYLDMAAFVSSVRP